jgi:hypothetical protein
VVGLVPATSIVLALCPEIQDRQDEPGDDAVSDLKRPKSALMLDVELRANALTEENP